MEDIPTTEPRLAVSGAQGSENTLDPRVAAQGHRGQWGAAREQGDRMGGAGPEGPAVQEAV